MFSVKLVNTYEDFVKIKPVWDKMVDYCKFPTIFQLYSWCKVWWNVYGQDKGLYILIINKDSIPIGLAPLMLSGHSKKRSVGFIGTGKADYTDFMINPEFKKEALECIFNFLLQNKNCWAKITLTQMSERTGSMESLRDVLSNIRYSYRLDEIEQCHSFEYSNNTEERKEYECGLSKHRNLRNSVNFFNKKGSLCYESVKDKDKILKKLPELFFFHWRRWEKTFTPSKFLNSRDRKFYYELTKELYRNDNISLEKLSVDNKSLAYVYSFLYKNTIFLYTASFDVFFRKKSPSTILYYYIIESYIKNGYSSIDFMRGGEQYKEKLTSNSYVNYELVLYKDGIEYRALKLINRLKKSALGQKVINNSSIRLIKQYAQSMISEHGLPKATKVATKSLFGKFFQYKQISVYEFGGSHVNLRSNQLNTDFVELFDDNADSVAGFYGAEMKSEKHEAIMQRFAEGNRCFALKFEGLYIALCFVQYFPFAKFNFDMQFSFDNNDSLVFDMFIIPEFQTDIVKNYFYSAVEKICKRNGCRCLMIIEKKEHLCGAKFLPKNLNELQRSYSISILNKILYRF